MMRAIELGLHLNKPWGEVMPYDFAVEYQARFVRVQVKSTMFKDRGGYSCTVRGSGGPYEGDPFDLLAAYVFQEDLWYIIPAELVVGQGSIALYPKLSCAKYGPYKEAWHLLRQTPEAPDPGRVGRLEACADGGDGVPSGIFQEAILVPVTRVRVVGSGIEGGADVLEYRNPSYTSTGFTTEGIPLRGLLRANSW